MKIRSNKKDAAQIAQTKKGHQTASKSDVQPNLIRSLHRAVGNQAVKAFVKGDEVGSEQTVDSTSGGRERTNEADNERKRRSNSVSSTLSTTSSLQQNAHKTTINIQQALQIQLGTQNGRPLPDDVRKSFESYFGRDLRNVRVHTDPRADEAARAINAEAFSYGPVVVFKGGKYNLNSLDGKQLLAHELTHVIQQRGHCLSPHSISTISERESVGRVDDRFEREASQIAKKAVQPSETRRVEQGISSIQITETDIMAGQSLTIQRKPDDVTISSPVIDTTLEQAGAIAGAVEGRLLSSNEQSLAELVFHESIDYERVRLATSGPTWTTAGNVIFVPEDFSIDDAYHARTFIHEMTHIWQYQHGGSKYITISLGRQLASWIRSGSRGGAYQYEVAPGVSIFDYRPEQQASIVEAYFVFQRRKAQLLEEGRSVSASLDRTLQQYERLVKELTSAIPRTEIELLEQNVRENLMPAQPLESESRASESLLPIRPIFKITF